MSIVHANILNPLPDLLIGKNFTSNPHLKKRRTLTWLEFCKG